MSKISVVMPVYNTKEEYFREAIESILKQTFQDFELLIIDNGSDSFISSIVSSYNDERIRYFRLELNQGPAVARNLGLKHASSPYIAFLDSDDIAYPERLQKQYNYMVQHPEIGCLGTKVKGIGNLANKVNFPKPTQHKDIELWLLFNGCVFCQSSVMLRKEILDKNKIQYNPHYVPTEDYALWLDLIGLTQFAVLEECLGEYRFYSENISNKQSALQYERGNEAQIQAIAKYLNIVEFKQYIFQKFLLEKYLSMEDLRYVVEVLPQIRLRLLAKGYTDKEVCNLFRNHFRKLFYHVYTISGQWLLLISPLNLYFGIKLYWRIFCLVFRGFFSINKGHLQ